MNNSKQKIAVLINSLEGGGAERVASNVLLELSDKFDFFLVLIKNVVVYEIPENQKIHILDHNEGKSHIKKILKLPALTRKYRKFLEDHDISISLSFMNRANFINGLLKKGNWKGKAIVSEQIASSMEYPGNTFKGKIGQYLIKKLYKEVDLMLATSEGIKYELTQKFKINSPCTVVHNPVNVDFINKKIQEGTQTKSDTFTFINVGRFQPQKNHTLLIEAFGKLKDLDCQLLLLGDGYLRPEIEKQIQRLGIEHKVKLLGFINNPYQYLEKADCFVLSSLWEGFPNVVLEALACGLPIISTDCPTGPAEILSSGPIDFSEKREPYIQTAYGYLVQSDTVDLLAKAMIDTFNNQDHLASVKALSLARAKDYNVTKVIKQYKEILEK